MSSKDNIVVAFDLYGTLLSTESIAKRLAHHFGEDVATSVAAAFRKYQLEYTWRLNSMGQYQPFSEVTRTSLSHSLREIGLELSAEQADDLMKAYDSLNTFPDVSPALETLASVSYITPVVFSNGTQSMVSNSVNKSPDLAPHASIFKDLIVVEPAKCYKPSPKVYELLAEKTGKTGKMGDMWLVSGNPFDIVGARSMGMQAAWVDRAGHGWVDELVSGEKGRPTVVCRDLKEVVAAVQKSAN